MYIKALTLAVLVMATTIASADNNANPFVDYNGMLPNPSMVAKLGNLYTYQDQVNFYALFETPTGYESEIAPAPLWVSDNDRVNTAALYYAGKAGYDLAAVSNNGKFDIYAIKDKKYFGMADVHKRIADDTVLLGVILAQETNPSSETMNALK